MARVEKDNIKELPEKPWNVEDWFNDPGTLDRQKAAEKVTFQVIKDLVNSLVVYTALKRKSNHLDDNFPVNETVKQEAQKAKNQAVIHMKDLLSRWDSLTG